MGSEGIVVVIIGLIIGFTSVKIFQRTKFGKAYLKKIDKKQLILNNPDLLVEKLNEGMGKVDDGNKISYSVAEVDGKKIVKMHEEKIPIKAEPKEPKKPDKKKSNSKKRKVYK